MKRLVAALAAALAAVSLSACGMPELSGTKTYVAPHFVVEGERGSVTSGISSALRERGWEVVVEDDDKGVIQAHSPAVRTAPGTEERETWDFLVDGGEVTVRRSLELRDEGQGEWKRSAVVCAGYTYSMEALLVSDLRDAMATKKVATKS